jgi:hypothetical protein
MIISLSGYQGSGKTTVANYLVEKHGFVHFSFANALKQVLSILFNWDLTKLQGTTPQDRLWRETIDTWWAEKLNIPNFSPRFAMQFIGTDIFREHFHSSFWTLIVQKQISELLETNHIVISDCRFPDEYQMLSSFNTFFLLVERNSTKPVTDQEFINLHVSESYIESFHFDGILYNHDFQTTSEQDSTEQDSSEQDSTNTNLHSINTKPYTIEQLYLNIDRLIQFDVHHILMDKKKEQTTQEL